MNSDDILDMIDQAIGDADVGPDAVRVRADLAPEKSETTTGWNGGGPPEWMILGRVLEGRTVVSSSMENDTVTMRISTGYVFWRVFDQGREW